MIASPLATYMPGKLVSGNSLENQRLYSMQGKNFRLQEGPLSSTNLGCRVGVRVMKMGSKTAFTFLALLTPPTLVCFTQHWKERVADMVFVSITWLFVLKLDSEKPNLTSNNLQFLRKNADLTEFSTVIMNTSLSYTFS